MNTLFTRMAAALLIICATAALPACKDPKPASAAVTQAEQSEFKTYQKDGLEVSYPSHWRFDFDEEPSPYGKRGIGLETSEVSAAFIYITHGQDVSVEEFAGLLTDGLKSFGDDIVDLNQSPITSGNHQGKKITWTNKMLGIENKAELRVIKIQNHPNTVFAVTNFSDEDIAKDSIYIDKFVESITYN